MLRQWVTLDIKPQFDAFIKLLRKQSVVAADTETTGLEFFKNHIVGFSFSFDDPSAPTVLGGSLFGSREVNVYIPIRHETNAKQLDEDYVLDSLFDVFEDPELTTIWHNAKFDINMLRGDGVTLRGTVYDSYGQHVLRNELGSHKLGDLAHELLGAPLWKDEVREHLKVKARELGVKVDDLNYGHVDIDVMTEYACKDTRYTWELFHKFLYIFDDSSQLKSLFYDVEMPLTPILAEMEYKGALLDVEYLKKVQIEAAEKTKDLQAQINCDASQFLHKSNAVVKLRREIAETEKLYAAKLAEGKPVKAIFNRIHTRKKALHNALQLNINSAKQLREYFAYLGIPIISKTQGGARSVAKLTLLRLASTGRYPVADQLMEYRHYEKLGSTYIVGLLTRADSRDILHTEFRQYGAKSGRMSSANPNLQNIPRGPTIRKAFIAPEGYIIVCIDFSQIELRLAAHFSEDANMLDIYSNDGDIHQRTADALGCPSRQYAKPINFGLLYGMGDKSLIDNAYKDYGVIYTPDEAKKYYRLFWNKAYPGLRKWVDKMILQIKRKKYSDTYYGRRRHAPNISSKYLPKWQREKEVRSLVNHIIQGTAADMLKKCIVRVNTFLRQNNCKTCMVLNIHDEIIFYWHLDELHFLPAVVDIMENWDDDEFLVPITVGVAWSKTSWGDKQELALQ